MTEEREYTILDSLQDTYSDLYKDCYGVRPRFMSAQQWTSVEWLRAEIESLGPVLERVIADERETERIMVERFEQRVRDTIALGARDRATAVRWIRDALDDGGDKNYAEYQLGIPYGYIERTTKEGA